MDGFEATRRIRRREMQTGGHVRIIAMTAHALQEDKKRCLDAGMDGYISKPFSPEELFYMLEHEEGSDGAGEGANNTGKDIEQIEPHSVPLNLEELNKRTRGDKKLIGELIEIFKATAPGLINEISECVSKDDSESMYRAAHSLKGAAGMLAAPDVQSAALKVEMLGRQGKMKNAVHALAELQKAMEQLLPYLDDIMGKD